MKLHELSVKRPIAITMSILIFIVIGLYSWSKLSIEMMPDINFSMALIITRYPNVGPSEVENLVTKTIEDGVSSASGIKTITSQTNEGVSIVAIEFDSGVDVDRAVDDVKDKLDLAENFLPEEVEDPLVMKLNMDAMPVAMMNASVDGYDLVQTKKFLEDEVESKLEAVSGVASISITGAQDRQVEVTVDPEKLFGYNLSLSDIVTAMSAQNVNLPSGQTEGMGKKINTRTIGKFKNVSDIEVVPITTTTGQVIYLRDIASVKDTYSEETSFSRLNGEKAISINITKQSGSNTVEVIEAVKSVLEGIKQQNPKFSYNFTMEQASYIQNAVNSVSSNAVSGALLAVLTLLLFLGSMRSSLIIGISMPISVVTTFIGMYFAGMSLNVVSLGGLALGVGMLVDNSVVVLENIYRRRKEHNEDSKTASMKGAGEVIGALIASTITTCIVYVPLFFVDNIMATMFKQLAYCIVFSQVSSIITTFMLVPMLSSMSKDEDRPGKILTVILRPFESLLNKMYSGYDKGLRWALSHRKSFIAAILALFVVSLVVLSQLGMTLMSATDEGSLTVNMELPSGTRLETTDEITKQAEDIIAQNKYVKTISTNVGSGSSMMGSLTEGSSSNSSSITVTLIDKKKRNVTTNDVVDQLRKALSSIAGADITLAASNNTTSMSSDEVQFEFTGADDKALEDYVLKAEKVLASIKGVTQTSNSIDKTKSEIKIDINDTLASKYGLNTATVSKLINYALGDTKASKYTENGKEYDIVLNYPDNYVSDYTQLKNLRLKTYTGQWIALGDIADVRVEQGYSSLTRVDQKRTITLTGKLYGTDMGTVNKAFNKEMTALETPDGIGRKTAGSYQTMIDAMLALLLAIVLGILLMYLVMAAQFENLVQPLIIMGSIPLAIIGVVLSLVIAQSPLSVVGCIGILMLVGIIVSNAIVLIDFINTARVEYPEMERMELIVYACKTRMRPVLMTTFSALLGYLPMAISGADGSEMMSPLATVLIGGLSVGTVLTLVFIPIVLTIVEDRISRRKEKKERKKVLKAQKVQSIEV